MEQVTKILIQQLEKKGLIPIVIPGFIRTVFNIISANHHISPAEINRQLNLLGWDTIELDDYTLELMAASFEREGLMSAEDKPAEWFESTYKVNSSSIY